MGTQQPYNAAPNAALLIDFDNVTMAIRSDLGKELKSLLRSDVIRGKVAVQRAYADWRRYPQYIVPLTESSVDLIFAPAYGSSKKNATDLRMAIDAIELVFTRPEIGTFILMTGDSDFSSCVLKLKEYGKYVIGVGMRESSSDLLIQNCDEYYSYHSISGLTRAGEVKESIEDPWVLVKRAVQQMVKDGDVMRTDRLKQVMIDLEPGFDEKKLGYSKFSRFVSEAATKGLLKLKKTEAGQYEIVTDEEEGDTSRDKVVERIVAEAEATANGRRRRGRGMRGDRPPREDRPAPKPIVEEPAEGAAERAAEPEVPAVAAVVADRPLEVAAEGAGAAPESIETAEELAPIVAEGLQGAYALLQEAVRRLTNRDAKSVRDGDVKRRMLEIARDFDETRLGFPKFTRFLRQAHDAEVIDLNRTSAGNYEVSLPAGGKRLPPPAGAASTAPAAAAGGGGAGDGAVPGAKRADEADAQQAASAPRPSSGRPEAAAQAPSTTRPEERRPAAPAERPERAEPERPAAQLPSTSAPEARPTGQVTVGAIRGRRGAKGPLSGPPPILPGQAVALPSQAKPATEQPAVPAPEAEPEQAVAEAEKPSRARRGRRGRGRKDSATTATEAAAAAASAVEATEGARPAATESAAGESPPASEGPASADAQPVGGDSKVAEEASNGSRSRRGRRGRGGSKKPAAAGAADVESAPAEAAAATETPPEAPTTAAPASDTAPAGDEGGRPKRTRGGRGRRSAPASPAEPEATAAPDPEPPVSSVPLGLPSDTAGMINHLSAYKGVGRKTAEQLVERYGTGLYEALESRPDEIRALLGDRRTNALLGQWAEDRASRTPAAEALPNEPEQTDAPPAEPARRPRRGGRGRGGRKEPSAG